MDKLRLGCALLLCLSACLAAGGAPGPRKDKRGEWVYDEFSFEARSGRWSNPRAWKGGEVPAGALPRVNIEGGRTVTLDTPVASPLAQLNVGLSGKTEFYFGRNARLSAGRVVMPLSYAPGATAEFIMDGGALEVGGLKDEAHNHFLNVGTGVTCSGGARFVVSGGTLSAGLRLGSDRPGTHTGAFCVKGSAPHISAGEASFFRGGEVFASGTLEFVLDEQGVAPVDFGKNPVVLHAGASVRVDGARYRGKPRDIPLLHCGDLTAEAGVRTQADGFPAGWRAEIVFEEKGAKLRLCAR